MRQQLDYALASPRSIIRWAGWEANLATLHGAGWQVASEEVYHNDSLRLILRHDALKLYAVTSQISYMRAMHSKRLDGYLHDKNGPQPLTFDVVSVSPQMNFATESMPALCLEDINLVDPSCRRYDPVVTSIEDMGIFKRMAPEVDILFQKADMSVVEHLEAIKAIQSPKQAELREKARRADQRPDNEGDEIKARLVLVA